MKGIGVPDWNFWKVLFSGAAGGALVVIALIEGVARLKKLFTNQAKPQLLDVQNCSIRVLVNTEIICFELLINNAGPKDCSITSVDLTWPDGLNADLGREPSTPLPKTIPSDTTERIAVHGVAYEFLDTMTPKRRLELKAGQPPEADITIKFNTKKIIKGKVLFTDLQRP